MERFMDGLLMFSKRMNKEEREKQNRKKKVSISIYSKNLRTYTFHKFENDQLIHHNMNILYFSNL